MKKHFLKIEKSVRYFSLGEPSKAIKNVWFVLHGYAQNADDFLNCFEGLLDEETLIVAPEGMSHFYWKDFSSDPVSSWMTSLDRTQDVADINNYLNLLKLNVTKEIGHSDFNFHCAGFSQGVPIAMRWVVMENIEIQSLVMIAGQVAHDVLPSKLVELSKKNALYYLYGNKDRFIDDKTVTQMKELYSKDIVNFNVYRFEGRHEVNVDVINFLKDLQTKHDE